MLHRLVSSYDRIMSMDTGAEFRRRATSPRDTQPTPSEATRSRTMEERDGGRPSGQTAAVWRRVLMTSIGFVTVTDTLKLARQKKKKGRESTEKGRESTE